MDVADYPPFLCYSWFDGNHSVVNVCSVSEVRKSVLEGPSFESWSHANSILTCAKLKHFEIPQEVLQIDSEVVHGMLYLCFVCNSLLMVYELLPSEQIIPSKWINDPVIHESSCTILHAKLRYCRQLS